MSNTDDTADKGLVWHDNYRKEDRIDHYENQIYEIGDNLYRKLFSRLLIISAVWFLVLVIFFIVVISRSQDSAGEKQILAIDKRLDRLEADFTLLTTEFASKLDRAIKEMERDKHTTAKQKTPSAQTPSPLKEEQKDVEPKVHEVDAGESLSRISRYYGLSIKQLRDFNNLEPNATIYPGQELKLTPQP